jgi:hypothetical protein
MEETMQEKPVTLKEKIARDALYFHVRDCPTCFVAVTVTLFHGDLCDAGRALMDKFILCRNGRGDK